MIECSVDTFAKTFNVPIERMVKQLEKLIEIGLVVKNGDMYRLSETGYDFMKFISPPMKNDEGG